MSVTPSALTHEEVALLRNDPAVTLARNRLLDRGLSVVSFTVPAPSQVKESLKQTVGLDLNGVDDVPMRWIRGDTVAHADVGTRAFTDTYLVYLTDSEGSFVVDGHDIPIQTGTGVTFREGLVHGTRDTGSEPRLLLGPMSEQGFPVGAATVIYYENEVDASNSTNGFTAPSGLLPIGQPAPFQVYSLAEVNAFGTSPPAPIAVPPGNIFGGWIAQSTGDPSPLSVYPAGTILPNDGTDPTYFYRFYPLWLNNAPCFLEGSTLLCQVDGAEVYVPIEQIRKGTLVKTAKHGFKAVDLIGRSKLYNPGHTLRSEHRLYRCSTAAYPELTSDLFITGCHSLLVASLTDKQREDTVERLEKVFVTDDKYRLMACVDERAEPYAKEGVHTIWHLSLETDNIFVNYGVYANGGLLVETICKRRLRDLSGMELV
jgi:hypothetical protein